MRRLKIRHVDQCSLDSIEGWLSEDARIVTQFVFSLQRENGWISGVLELGVFKGKYLSLLAQQAAGSGVPIVGVDAFLEKHGVPLSSEYKIVAEQGIRNSVRTIAGAETDVTLIAGFTSEVNIESLRQLCQSGFSFISVDAGHDAEDVEHDSAIADKLLSNNGVAAFDDIYNAVCPGVAEGFMRYMTTGDRALAPFATSGNKVFVCRPKAHAHYYEFSKELARNIRHEASQLSGTYDQLIANEQNGWSPKLLGYDIIPFL